MYNGIWQNNFYVCKKMLYLYSTGFYFDVYTTPRPVYKIPSNYKNIVIQVKYFNKRPAARKQAAIIKARQQ